MNVPANLKFAKTDEWVKVVGKVAVIGVSDYAQNQLSDIVYVEATVEIGQKVKKNAPCFTLESVKAAAEANTPVGGTVVEINEALSQTPELVNSDPFGEAWMFKIEMDNPADLETLLDAAGYEKYCQERDH